MDIRNFIAKNAASKLEDGMLVNLGFGIPTEIPKFIPEEVSVYFQAECGVVGYRSLEAGEEEDEDFVDAAGDPVGLLPYASLFDSAMSFGMMRGGHLDYTVLGALQVDAKGNVANWRIPNHTMIGVGGAMDLVSGAKNVMICMEHCSKDGKPKILNQCSMPITGAGEVDYIVTEMAMIRPTKEGLMLEAIAPGLTVEEVQSKTEPTLIVSPALKTMLTVD